MHWASSIYDSRYQLHPLLFTYAMERLELLEPEVVSDTQRSVQAYALAYVEHYRGDVPQLERERDFLFAALTQAWLGEQYTQVVQLMADLTYLVGRLHHFDEGECVLLWGIQASRRIHDQQHLAYFLNRLGGLLFSRGKFDQAQQVWRESLEVANALGYPVYLWEPLSSFAHIADILGSYTAAKQFAGTLLHDQRFDDSSSLVVAIFIRGFNARLMGELDRAYDDLNSCLHLLSLHSSSASTFAFARFFTMEVQAELARVQSDYSRAYEYTEAALSLAQNFCDPYTVAALLFDQAYFAYQQSMFNDAHASLLRLLDISRQSGAPFYSRIGTFLLQDLASVSQGQRSMSHHVSSTCVAALPSPAGQHIIPLQIEKSSYEVSQLLGESLSKREMEVIQLVAEGLSNQEIATKLVITVGTERNSRTWQAGFSIFAGLCYLLPPASIGSMLFLS